MSNYRERDWKRIKSYKSTNRTHHNDVIRLMKDKEQLQRKYRRPITKKARATRGLIKQKLRIEVANRPLTDYEQAVREVVHV